MMKSLKTILVVCEVLFEVMILGRPENDGIREEEKRG